MKSWLARQRLRSIGWLLHAVGALLTLLIIGSGWVAHAALKRQQQSLRNTVTNSTKLLDGAAQIRQRREAAQQTAAAAQERLNTLLRQLPAAAEETEFLKQLAELSQHTGLQIDRFRPQRTVDQPPYKRLEVQIGGTGSYASVCRFLAGVEQMPRICHIRSLSVVASTTDESKCTLDLELDLFFAPGTANGAEATTP